MELSMELKSTLIHVAGGCVVGYISSLLYSNMVILLMAVVALFAIGKASQLILKLEPTEVKGEKKYGKKWWLSNGVWPYIGFWLFIWILFYNL